MFLTDLKADGGITYLEYTGKYGQPLWQFGEGLSYSNISETWTDGTRDHKVITPELLAERLTSSGSAVVHTFSVKVENQGAVVTDHVVLCFLASNHTRAFTNKKLVNFERIALLEPGQSRTITLDLLSEQIALPDATGALNVYPGAYDIRVGAVTNPLTASFVLQGRASMLSR